MARKRTSAKKPIEAKTPVEKKVEFSPDGRLTVFVGISEEYGKVKSGITFACNVKDDEDPMEIADGMFDNVSDKLIEKHDELAEKLGFDEEAEDEEEDQEESEEDEEWEEEDEEDSEDEDEEEDDDEEDGDDEEEDDYTEEEILKMKKAELLELIEEEELDVDPKGMKIKELREAVVEAYFEEEEEDDEDEESDDEEWDDEEWEDDDDEDED